MRLARLPNPPGQPDQTSPADLNTAADRAIDYLKRNQRLSDKDLRVQGGIAGSSPIWGRYSMFEYPNWASKFFADALIMHMQQPVVPPPVTAANQAPEPQATPANA